MSGDWRTAEKLQAGLTQEQRNRVANSVEYYSNQIDHWYNRNTHPVSVERDQDGNVTRMHCPAMDAIVSADKASHPDEAKEEQIKNGNAQNEGKPRVPWGDENNAAKD